MKILLTGADGFIGRNLASRLERSEGTTLLRLTLNSTEADLRNLASQAEAVVHLAGVNRPSNPSEFTEGNVGLTERLCQALQAAGSKAPILFSSSMQASRESPYGVSKRAAEDLLFRHGKFPGNRVLIYRLPGVFGKWAQPRYNSVVATFCDAAVRGEPLPIDDPASPVTLVYVDDVVTELMARLVDSSWSTGFGQVAPEYQTTVGDLARHICSFRAVRESLMVEPVGSGLVRALYATYLSYLPPSEFSYPLTIHEDARGNFAEILRTVDSGQFSVFTAHPGVTRGGHFHHTKNEKFIVVQGRARFRFRKMTDGTTSTLEVGGEKPVVVDMVPGWAHDITNIGSDELVVLLWANEAFDPGLPDTYPQPLEG